MNRKPMFLLVIFCLLMAQLVACSQPAAKTEVAPQATEAGSTEPTAPTQEKVEPTEAAAVEPTAEAAVEPTATAEEKAAEPTQASAPAGEGMACFGSYDFGLSCLNGGEWKTYDEASGSLDSDMVVDIATCPDQSIVVATVLGVNLFDGQTWKQLQEGWTASSPDAVACDANGGIWVAGYQAVSYFDGKSWTNYPSTELATGEAANDLLSAVAVSPDGTVWVETANSVAAFKDGQWTLHQQGMGFDEQMFFSKLAIDPQGNPWVGMSSGVATYNGTEWVKYENFDISSVEGIAIDANGRVWVGTFSSGLFMLEDGAWQKFDVAGGQLSSNHVRALSIDANGRLWAGTAYGLNVFDGSNWKAYRMDNTGINDNDTRDLVVIAGGPALPSETNNGAGSISGQLFDKDNKAMAAVRVDVCVEEPGLFFTETPCEEQPLIKTIETDAEGKFQVSDLPVGIYVVTAKLGESWAQLTDDIGIGSQRVVVKSGEDTNLGQLTQTEE